MVIIAAVCKNAGLLRLGVFLWRILRIFLIIIPIVLIASVVMDLAKVITSGSFDTVKKSFTTILKRIIACILIFFLPMLVEFAMEFVGDTSFKSCLEELSNTKLMDVLKPTQDLTGNKEGTSSSETSNGESSSGNSGSSSSSGSSSEKWPSSSGGTSSGKWPSSSSGSSSSGSSSSSGGSTQSTKITNFKLSKTSVTIGHYSKLVNTYKIKITGKNGQTLSPSKFTFKSSKPGVVSVSSAGKITGKFGGSATITISPKSNPSLKKTVSVRVVNGLYTKVKVTKKTTGTSLVTGKKVTLKKGTTGVYNGIGKLNPAYSGKDNSGGSLVGNIIRVDNDYIKINHKYVTPTEYYISNVYDTQTVENFVNTFNFSSKTKYLFWTNQGTQTVYMFTGSKGKWKLYRTFPVNTGDTALLIYPQSAATGVHFNYTVGDHKAEAGYPMGIIWKKTSSGGTNPWHQYYTGKRYPGSHGCTRFSESDLQYLINNNKKFKGSKLIDY